MKPAILATLIAAFLAGAAAASTVAFVAAQDGMSASLASNGHDHDGAAGADEHALHGGMAGDAAAHSGGAHDQTG
ncbi:MAG: hypothetical protein WC876_11835, partial [Candidatus Thermoplasmatota archaeon]